MVSINFRPIWRYQDQLIGGVEVTLLLTMIAALAGLAIGVLGAASLRSGPKAVRLGLRAYIEIIRNTPVLIQIFIIYFVLPDIGVRLPPLAAAATALSLYFGAYAIEIVRSGLDSIPRSQMEAGQCLGLTRFEVFWHVILPPALRNIYPSLTSQFVLLLLGTSIASQVAVDELFHVAGFIDSRTYRSFEVYALACGIYFAIAFAFRLGFAVLGRLAFRWPVRR
jgi:polar amino acid transport system permease protein